ncbi:sigma-70 family RNA polymerase sigma factor [Fredinandcohnia sp. 179-A 10B2 NHS]|uniref:sigma-70 family RNA polymerase sigma factor n=1 Tax=Fredinandcohnia sp. 179-A 10B2 NHS TaxID=3235176 RepID=UPI0039A27E20
MEDYINELSISDDKVLIIERLLDDYGTEIKRLAYLYVKDHSLAEDIVQEVFISCYRNLEGFRYESSYKTWLVKITINKCKDALKRWSFRNLIYKEKIDDSQYEIDTPEDKMISKLEDIYISKQVLQLPLKFREVIILYYYQELSIEEISQVMNIKVNTVKTRLYRARVKLKESMEGSEYEWKED